MIIIVAFIVTLVMVKMFLYTVPLEEKNKRIIMRVSSCFATVVAIIYYYRSKGITPPEINLTRSDSFSQASMISGGSLLSDF